MIEKFLKNYLPKEVNIIDVLFVLIFILFLFFIISILRRKKIKNEINNIPGYDINKKIIDDIAKINDILSKNSIIQNDFMIKINNLEKKSLNILNIQSIKYNPYQDMGVGGNQSFSTALVNKNGNGIILTSLYSRERTRILLKEIENFQGKQELAPEEISILNFIQSKK